MECHENPSLPKPSMSLRIGREIVLFLWLHSKPFKFALVHKMLPNRNCIWRLNCVEVVVDDRFRKRVLAGCVPSSRGWWQYVITHLDCVKCPPPLINSVLGKKRSQIGLMAWLHTLNVTLKLIHGARRRCHKRYLRYDLKTSLMKTDEQSMGLPLLFLDALQFQTIFYPTIFHLPI